MSSDGLKIGISKAEQKKFEKQFGKATKTVQDKLRQIVAKSAMNIQAQAKANITENKGRVSSALFNSIRVVYSQDMLTARILAGKDYAVNYEFGTKSNMSIPAELITQYADIKTKEQSFDELYQGIKLWCRRKGIDTKAAYPIARKIANEGQQPHPFLYPAFKDEKEKFLDNIKSALK